MRAFTPWLCILAVAACGEWADRAVVTAPSFAAGGVGRPSVLVNPNAHDRGTPRTIREGIAWVAPGGKVMVLPGTYHEALVIDKPVTLEGVGGKSGAVIVAPPGGSNIAMEIATSGPVVIRGLTVHVPGTFGIWGGGAVDLTVERSNVLAVDPPLGVSFLVAVDNNAGGSRARMVVRHSFVDGTVTDRPNPIPQSFALGVRGDVDAVLEGNVLRRSGGACIFVMTRDDLGGELNAEILENDLDECHPAGRAGAILVGPVAGFVPTPTHPVTATGVVNIIGNTFRNSSASCRTNTAVTYEVFTGRIEHNSIHGVVQGCAFPSVRSLPGAIFIGNRRPFFPAVTPTVRFNDIEGNAHAGLRLASNQTGVIDASCNWWGAASGPSGVGPGTGDAVVVEAGATAPLLMPFASGPIAKTGATSC